MVRTASLSTKAPAPIPFISQAITCNGFIFCSGSLGLDPKTGEFVEGTTFDRAKQAILNLGAVLEGAGSDLSNVIKLNCFLSDMKFYEDFNRAFGELFLTEPKPARTCVVVAQLPKNAELELEAVAEA